MKAWEEIIQFLSVLGCGLLNDFDNWAKDSKILLPILLSIIAALIFWMVFSYLPEQKRRKKLRPVVELILFDVYKKLFSLFDLIMRHSNNSPSFYQSEIRSGKLSEDTIALGLQNKCLNESYLYDPNAKNWLLVIGQQILDQSFEIDELVNKILSFHTYATAEEILLLEDIREKVRMYGFSERHINRSCETTINGHTHRPVNPSINYRRRNFYEIYQLFCKLQTIVLDRKPLDRDRFIYKMQFLYYAGQHKLCIKLIRSEREKFENDSILYRNYLALSELGAGNSKSFYKIMEDTYRSRPYNGSLVSSRSTFKNLLGDNKLIEIIAQFHSSAEISALKQSVEIDQRKKEEFEHSNQELEKYFTGKLI